MSKARTTRLPGPIWDAFELLYTRPDGPFDEYDSANAAAVGLFLWATTFHQKKHRLGADILKLPGQERDLIFTFIHFAVKNGMDLGKMMPKPATAKHLRDLAKAWWSFEKQEFRKPPPPKK